MASSPAPAVESLRPFRAAEIPERSLDFWTLGGIVIAAASLCLGIVSTGVSLLYFLQPTGGFIVLGGTLGVTLITTPRKALLQALRRAAGLLRTAPSDRAGLAEEILQYAKPSRSKGIVAIEAMLGQASNSFLNEALTWSVDARDREDLRGVLETKLRLRERQGDADAKVLEVAGGFAPTIGVLGTVVGLIDVLRQFSNLGAVSYGIGAAFVSTIYGLALANLVLLPAAHRIRAEAAETFKTEEMIVDAALALRDGSLPSLLRERLNTYLRDVDQ